MRPSRRSSSVLQAVAAPERNVREALNARVRDTLGRARVPRSAEAAPVLLHCLRQTLPYQCALDSLVPELRRDYAQQGAKTGVMPKREEAAALYRLLRMVWLAEMVFGDMTLACDWLSEPKARLHGHPPALQMHGAREAGAIERWLVDIDEGNGP
ncbi:MbcA/ParS/Xre antitoxin family protein [Orrella sp. JC864]|uniref:MbcA/ParS/Xre antitoxin family protein n=1 Tax=Orrella sp. JC864 TaxID=3120298 RepID=UPI00300A611D